MNEKYGKYLPIGTVVMLKGGKKRAMITGFCSTGDGDQNKIYDYNGCIYPEGYLSSNKVCLFDHDQIEKIYHLGLVDEEEKIFKTRLNQFMNSMNGQGVNSNQTSQSSKNNDFLN